MSQFGINGLAITPPLLGRISIGHVEEKNGKRLPVKDDQITVTTQFQRNKQWVKHPLDESLRRKVEAKKVNKDPEELTGVDLLNTKLRSIPVKLLFNDPNLNLRAEYTCFEKGGRTLCKGNGADAMRYNHEKNAVEKVACNPVDCKVAEQYRCKPYTRFNVQIDGQDDELGSFMYRTVGWNSLRTLQSKLTYLHGLTNGKLAGMPLELIMRGKSSQQSMGSTFFYLDLVVREGYTMASAVKEAHAYQKEWEEAGINREAFEEHARQGIANGMFEDNPDEIGSVLEEFFPDVDDSDETSHSNDLRKLLDSDNVNLGPDVGQPAAEATQTSEPVKQEKPLVKQAIAQQTEQLALS